MKQKTMDILKYLSIGWCPKMAHNVSGLCVVALSRNLKLTTTLDRAITQNPCYVPFFQSNN